MSDQQSPTDRAKEDQADPWSHFRGQLVVVMINAASAFLEKQDAPPVDEVINAITLGVPLELLSRALVGNNTPADVRVEMLYRTKAYAEALAKSVTNLVVVLEDKGLADLIREMRERQDEYQKARFIAAPIPKGEIIQ